MSEKKILETGIHNQELQNCKKTLLAAKCSYFEEYKGAYPNLHTQNRAKSFLREA